MSELASESALQRSRPAPLHSGPTSDAAVARKVRMVIGVTEWRREAHRVWEQGEDERRPAEQHP